MHVTMQGHMEFERGGITFDFSQWPEQEVNDISIPLFGLREGNSYFIEASIHDSLVAVSFPVRCDGDRIYCFTFKEPFIHKNQPVKIRICNINGNIININTVTTTSGSVVRL